jgi:hypothetical protein
MLISIKLGKLTSVVKRLSLENVERQSLLDYQIIKETPLVKEILNCTNKEPGLLQRGDNHKNAKIWRGH